MSRKVEEIKQEYSNLALKAGTIQYEVLAKQKDLALINERLRDLNLEYVQATNAEAEAATPGDAVEPKQE